MSNNTLEDKLNQFKEFFSIKHPFNINITPIDNNELSYDDFINLMPAPFKLANDIIALDQAALAPLQALSGIAGQLVQYLNHQAQKIDLLVGHIISEQDNLENRSNGLSFGGGGIEFFDEKLYDLHSHIELKIFLSNENCAIFCHGEIVHVEASEQGFTHQVIFKYIREDDREILVRSSLHIQTRQLKALAEQRNKAVN